MTQGQISSEVQLQLFHKRITGLRRQAGYFQKDLANALGLDTGTLSRKLHGRAQMVLTDKEIKQIIITLAEWKAISSRAEALELLALMGLQLESFSPDEWQATPLNDLGGPRLPSKRGIEPTQRTPPFPPTSIPEPLTSFIGREEEIAQICQLLKATEVRLLTLLGTAGVGKTRLSVAVAQQMSNEFPDGIFFISLAAIQDALLIPSKITETFHLNGPIHHEEIYAPSQLHILSAFLHEKRVLLVLDNFEHLLAAAPFVGDLLLSAPSIKILITSRTALRLYGENEWIVPSLPTSNPIDLADPQILALMPAVRLFLARALAVKRDIPTSEKNIATIAAICHALNGLPLAIELAAARCKVLSLQTILHLLTADEPSEQEKGKRKSRHILSLFQQEAANVPFRHWSLARTLDWSYELLDGKMQRLFLQLAVFLGGWTLPACQAICHLEGDNSLSQMTNYLEQLVNHSLVIQDWGNEEVEMRFTFPEIIREYALEHLNQNEMRDELFQRHALYYLTLVEQVEPDLSTPQRQRIVQILAKDEGNFRAALHWADEKKNAELIHRLCGALSLFWEAHSQFAEAHKWLDKAVAIDEPVAPLQRANVLLAAARLAHWESNWEQARIFADQALHIFLSYADPLGEARSIFQIGDAWHMQGEYIQAITYFDKSLALYLESKDWRNYAFTLSRLGAIDLLSGAFVSAQERLDRSVELFRQYGDPWGLSVILASLSILHLLQRADVQALEHLNEALSYGNITENSFNIALILTAFGCAIGSLGQPETAAQLWSSAEKIFEGLGTTLPTAYQPIYDHYKRTISQQAEAQSWQDWWLQGKTLSRIQATALAFQAYQPYRQASMDHP